MGKLRLALVAGIILIIPFILVYQLSKGDINIEDFTHPIQDTDPFENKCFYDPIEKEFQFGEISCTYVRESSRLGEIIFTETDTKWQVTGDQIWCVKIERSVMEPVADPVGSISESSIGESQPSVECNDIAIFDKDEWNLQITHADLIDGGSADSFRFTLK